MVWSSGFRLWISNPEKAGFEEAICHLRVVSIKWPTVIVTGHKPYNGHILKVVISESFILPKAAHTQRHFTYSTCGTTVQSFVVCISKIFPLGISQPDSIWWILKHNSIHRGFFSILTIIHVIENSHSSSQWLTNIPDAEITTMCDSIILHTVNQPNYNFHQ